MPIFCGLISLVLLLSATPAQAYGPMPDVLHRVTSLPGLICLGVFLTTYVAVVFEESLRLRKSKPMLVAASVIWAIIAIAARRYDVDPELIENAFMHDLEEWASLGLFLLVAMTYINALTERGVFDSLRSWLQRNRFSYRKMFWMTGVIGFFLSAIADNLTSALILSAVIVAVGSENRKFVVLGCVNLVVACNAGGAFSPFGDITTLMVWQSGNVRFFEFFVLFLPSVVNYLIPALIMTPFIPQGSPRVVLSEARLLRGGVVICCLFVITLAMAVSAEQFLHLPSFAGMIAGMSLLMLYAYYLNITARSDEDRRFDIFDKVARVEWDTLFFFYGVMFGVGGLSFIGYLDVLSTAMYTDLGPTVSNVLVGLGSAVFDNIPIMFAVLSMNPDMGHFQWLLVTLTAGVGGSALAVGSAAGVGVLGVARGQYTFFSHLKWSPVILLGYAGAVVTHFLVNA